MAIDTSQLQKAQNIRIAQEELTNVMESAGKTPLWKTLMGIGIPLLASMAMPGIGGLLAKAPGIAGWLGQGLASTGAAGAANIPTLLQGLLTKGAASSAVGKATRGYLSEEKKDLASINLSKLTPIQRAYGKKGVEKAKKDYRKAMSQKKDTGTISDLLGASFAQFGTTDIGEIGGLLGGAAKGGLGNLPSWFMNNIYDAIKYATAGAGTAIGAGTMVEAGKQPSPVQYYQKGGLIKDGRERFFPQGTITDGLLNRKG
tara:strand:+ start:544 stop:1317 length:774 start_codon:yes stop_codon:yes gene_type:complete